MTEFFPGQKDDEKVLVLARPHWLVMLRSILALVFLSILPVIVLVAAGAADLEPFSGNARAVTVTLTPAFYLGLITWFFIRWLDYYLDVGIVTDERVVDIDQRGLFRRNIAELDCRVVQDVSSDKTGIFQTVFDFGDVVIQTAGEHPNFTFPAVPHPEAIVDKIQHAVGGKTEAGNEAHEKMAEAAEDMKNAAEDIKDGNSASNAGPGRETHGGEQEQHAAREKAEETAEKVRERTKEKTEEAKEKAKEVAEPVRDTGDESPQAGQSERSDYQDLPREYEK